MAETAGQPAAQSGQTQPTAEELREIVAELDFFLEMDQATALEAEDEAVADEEEKAGAGKGGGDGSR